MCKDEACLCQTNVLTTLRGQLLMNYTPVEVSEALDQEEQWIADTLTTPNLDGFLPPNISNQTLLKLHYHSKYSGYSSEIPTVNGRYARVCMENNYEPEYGYFDVARDMFNSDTEGTDFDHNHLTDNMWELLRAY